MNRRIDPFLLIYILFGDIFVIGLNAELRIHTTEGTVIGEEAKNNDRLLVNVFQGIPYARPPMGNDRFRVS